MKSATQLSFGPEISPSVTNEKSGENGDFNKLQVRDRAVHDWYRFVLSFPPHLVRRYIEEFGLGPHNTVLDPFCGTGTTIVEAKLQGIPAIGVEANRFAHFASSIKTDWDCDPESLTINANAIAEAATARLAEQGLTDGQFLEKPKRQIKLQTLPEEQAKLLLTSSISPLPLHKTLVLLDCLKAHKSSDLQHRYELLALAKALVYSISNLHFGPEVGVGKAKTDVAVIAAWLTEVERMSEDLRQLAGRPYPKTKVFLADARQLGQLLLPNSIDAIITSPPYPNEKDYTRTTRLESVILGFIKDKADLRTLRHTLIRSNTRNVYKGDQDDQWIAQYASIQKIANEIEQRRIELGKNSGFEKMYAKVTRQYFGGMARHLASLRPILRPGAHLAYVVGDQASFFRIMIRTGQLLAEIAVGLGYELVRIDLFRTRFASATQEQLREEVVVLRWRG